MKKIFILAALVLSIMSCSKMDGIFDGSDKDAISPIQLDAYGNNVFSDTECSSIAPSLLNNNGVSTNHRPLSGKGPTCDAIVVNDAILINELADQYDLYSRLSVQDVNNFSLVVGYYDVAQGNYHLTQQKVKCTNKKINLYLKIEEMKTSGACAPSRVFFVSLYPKLPIATVQIFRSDSSN